MGQAFDREGKVLGSASGETKREVFDELNKKHPTAHEIRVRELIEEAKQQGAESGSAPDPAPEPLMQFFQYDHLPERLQAVSRPYGVLAALLIETLPRVPERTVALRKLLESKDCAVRAAL